ncbi:HEPN domain-containing protein [Propionivibrio sp.]|uniref:HEPN domain-containing protein n=1 Tax=Propionivibrio sp. TaxID=2212460 RepID=UPI003BF0CE8B
MSPHDEQARELLAAAGRDEVTFHILRRNGEAPVESTLFHAQQALEKGLKAALVSEGIIFRRIHDLLELCELAKAHGLSVPTERELLARLAPYAVEFRYLGVTAPKVSLDEARTAVEELMAWARAKIGSEKASNP